jgi:hypothetical protein
VRTICEAIRTRSILEFDYRGHRRIVAPYCHGASARGTELLRAVQLRGTSASGQFGTGKLWNVAEMRGVRLLLEAFVPGDPHYNPDDRAMLLIHCRVDAARESSEAAGGTTTPLGD